MKEKVKKSKKDIKLDKKKITLCLVSLLIFIIVIVAVLFFIQKGSNFNLKREKWDGINYDEKIELFGFNKMYDECSDEITKIEALKINFLISMNKDSIENAFVEGYKYSDEDFILKNYAYTNNFKKVITKSNKDEKITVADELYALYLIEKGRYNDVETSEKITLENINNYEEEKKIAIQTMYDRDIVEKEDFEQVLTKEKSKEIMVKYIYVFKTMCRDANFKVLHDEENIESLYKLPFYTNESVEASKIPIHITENSIYTDPVEMSKEILFNYNKISNNTKSLLDIILNVNYEEFEKEDFNIKEYSKEINNCSIISNSKIEEYVEYVKQNKIKIEGSGYAIIPFLYYRSGSYYVRTYIDFKILNSNIDNTTLMQNIKFLDTETNEFEKEKEYKGYVDLKFDIARCLVFNEIY